jgi:CRP-like cAMP-binding protein
MITPGQVRTLPFFHSFEAKELAAIMPYFTAKKYPPGAIILEQDSMNSELYFLFSGSVRIFINDNFIADVNQKGEVFGEMSLANYSTCTATIKAKDEATFVIFAFEDMRKSIGPEVRDVVMKNFYKGAMEVLAAKMQNSNLRSFQPKGNNGLP